MTQSTSADSQKGLRHFVNSPRLSCHIQIRQALPNAARWRTNYRADLHRKVSSQLLKIEFSLQRRGVKYVCFLHVICRVIIFIICELQFTSQEPKRHSSMSIRSITHWLIVSVPQVRLSLHHQLRKISSQRDFLNFCLMLLAFFLILIQCVYIVVYTSMCFIYFTC